MKILITGANGFLAKNIFLLFLEKEHQVIGLLRDRNKIDLPEDKNLELIETDLTNLKSLETKFRECKAIIHIAAETRQDLKNINSYNNVNILITENLIQMAIYCGVKRFIYVSTANVFRHGTLTKLGSENEEIKVPFSKSYYALSKLKAQQSVLLRKKEIDVIKVNPTFLIGPYDSKPSSGKIILLGYQKGLIFYPPGGKNFVNVKDVANGILAAMEKGKTGESYLLAGENLSYKEFFKKLALLTDSKTVFKKIPKYILLLIGFFGNTFGFIGVRNAFTLTNMRILCTKNYYSNKKAKNDLNINFSKIDPAIIEACDWFKQNNILS